MKKLLVLVVLVSMLVGCSPTVEVVEVTRIVKASVTETPIPPTVLPTIDAVEDTFEYIRITEDYIKEFLGYNEDAVSVLSSEQAATDMSEGLMVVRINVVDLAYRWSTLAVPPLFQEFHTLYQTCIDNYIEALFYTALGVADGGTYWFEEAERCVNVSVSYQREAAIELERIMLILGVE